jgi:isoquinoline 1-oxidoreductase beta subunit
MLYAVVARCPVFGGKVASFDATKAKAVPGVKNVIQISRGIAVVADSTWSAMQGRRALEVKWDEGTERKRQQREHQQALRGSNGEARRGGPQGRRRGDRGAFRRAQRKSKRSTKFPTWRTPPWNR